MGAYEVQTLQKIVSGNLFDKILKNPSGNIFVQLGRYLVSGGVAFVVDTSLLYALTEWLGFHYLLSTLLSYSVGLMITYAFSILWVFDYRSVESRALEFSVFAVIGVMGLGLTSLSMWLFTSGLGFHYLWSKIITTIIVFVWNFIMKKFLLFRRRKKDE